MEGKVGRRNKSMSILAFNENNNSYSVEMKGIHFVCEKLKSGFEKKAVVLADIYL